MISNRRGLAPRISWVACLCATAMGAQQTVPSNPEVNNSAPAPPPHAPASLSKQQAVAESGLQNPWDVRKILTDLLNQNEQLQPLLGQLNPQQWYSQKGAPSTYIIQWQTAQQQLKDVKYATAQLQQKTESLSLA